VNIDDEVTDMKPEMLISPKMRDGDVIEVDGPRGAVTALVLLVNGTMAILDLCDGSTPVVVELDELGPYRVFEGNPLAAVA
jgi:hypothetical protein